MLWEFPNRSTPPQVVANLGYSYGKPIIAKVGDQGWVVLVSSGYNNINTITVAADGASTTYIGDGDGHLFVLNAKTGALIKDLPTLSGSTVCTERAGIVFRLFGERPASIIRCRRSTPAILTAKSGALT